MQEHAQYYSLKIDHNYYRNTVLATTPQTRLRIFVFFISQRRIAIFFLGVTVLDFFFFFLLSRPPRRRRLREIPEPEEKRHITVGATCAKVIYLR